MFASFYYIEENYIKYLQKKEIEHRGFTCVPNVVYANKEKFNYMFPVPLRCATQMDFRDKRFSNEYRLLLEQEYRYIKKSIKLSNIQKQAHKTYENVIAATDKALVRNSCDFKLLESAYEEYQNSENKGV